MTGGVAATSTTRHSLIRQTPYGPATILLDDPKEIANYVKQGWTDQGPLHGSKDTIPPAATGFKTRPTPKYDKKTTGSKTSIKKAEKGSVGGSLNITVQNQYSPNPAVHTAIVQRSG